MPSVFLAFKLDLGSWILGAEVGWGIVPVCPPHPCLCPSPFPLVGPKSRPDPPLPSVPGCWGIQVLRGIGGFGTRPQYLIVFLWRPESANPASTQSVHLDAASDGTGNSLSWGQPALE